MNKFDKVATLSIATILWFSIDLVAIRYVIGGLLSSRSDVALLGALAIFVGLIWANFQALKAFIKYAKKETNEH